MASTFQRDLERGLQTEARIREALNQVVGVYCESGPNDHSYDLVLVTPVRTHLLEIKDESNYTGSPNLCLELFQGSEPRPSGLLTSEATLTLHVFDDNVWVYRTNAMRLLVHDLCRDDPAVVRPFRNGENYVQGILLPKAWLNDKSWAWRGALEIIVSCPILDLN